MYDCTWFSFLLFLAFMQFIVYMLCLLMVAVSLCRLLVSLTTKMLDRRVVVVFFVRRRGDVDGID